MTGHQQQTSLPNPAEMSNEELINAALHCINVFRQGTPRLQGTQNPSTGAITLEAYGVPSLDSLSSEVWQQVAAAGIPREAVVLSEDSKFGVKAIETARARFGDAFTALETAMTEADAKVKEIVAKTEAEIEKIEAGIEAMVTALIGQS